MSLNSYYTPKLPDAMYVYDTPATNIQLLTLDKKKSLVDSTYYGINGGWFNLSASGEIGRGLLNITYCDGGPVGSATYGDPPRDGTAQTVGDAAIFYNGANKTLKEVIAESATDIVGVTNTKSWAQGGIALSLGKREWTNRKSVSANQAANAWTALVADLTTTRVHLIVTKDPSAKKTITQQDFRDAIMEYFDIPESSSVSSRYKGILLDGSDSTQMKVLNDYGNKVTIYNSKANRSLCSIVALRNKNI